MSDYCFYNSKLSFFFLIQIKVFACSMKSLTICEIPFRNPL
jgi:hypothetical protein